MSKRMNWSFDGTLAYVSTDGGASNSPMDSVDQTELDSTPHYTGGGLWFGSFATRLLYFNFPNYVTIDLIQMSFGYSTTITIEASSNSTNGIDGDDWTTIYSGPITGGTTVNNINVTPTSCTWIRMGSWWANTSTNMYRLLFYGNYDSPNFEFWNDTSLSLLTDNYHNLPDATKVSDYSDYHSFTIKNIHFDGTPKDYDISIVALKVGGDSFVPTYVKLSNDPLGNDTWTRTSTLSITNVPNGGFSEEIRVYVDLTVAQNSGDGYHYWTAKVVEV